MQSADKSNGRLFLVLTFVLVPVLVAASACICMVVGTGCWAVVTVVNAACEIARANPAQCIGQALWSREAEIKKQEQTSPGRVGVELPGDRGRRRLAFEAHLLNSKAHDLL